LKRPTKERGHTPREVHQHSPWIEPAVWDADFGSSAPFFASVFALSGEASWLVTRENCTKSNEYGQYRVDTVTSGKEKARERSEAGTWGDRREHRWQGAVGLSEATEGRRAHRHCGVVAVGGRRSAVCGAGRVESSRNGVSGR